MTSSAPAPRGERGSPLTVDEIVDTAQRLVEGGGVAALSMRRLAAELGVAPTAIYWHVGNRDALVAALVDRIIDEMGAIRVTGDRPVDRLVSIARSLRRRLRAKPHVIALVHEQGRTAMMFRPAQLVMAREFEAAGLRGADVAHALRAVEYLVIGFVVLERTRARSPEQHPSTEELWASDPPPGLDPEVVASLAEPPDFDALFELSVTGLVHSLVGGA